MPVHPTGKTSLRLDRRRFLSVSAVAMGGFFAPHVWTGVAAGADSKNEKLHVASIGVGNQGTWNGKWAAELGRVVAGCDVHLGRADTFAAKHSCPVYQDYRKLLDRKDIDVVTIATPDHWHVKIAVEAMQAGLDVYCEKPVTLTIDEGKILCNVVRKTGRVLQVGTDQRSDPRVLQAIALARSGRLGKNLVARVNLTYSSIRGAKAGPFPATDPPPELDWDMWQGQAPKAPFCEQRFSSQGFRRWLEYSGGSLTNWGAHDVDVAQLGLGLQDTEPVEIEGTGVLPQVPNAFSTAYDYDCTLRFANGATIFVRDENKTYGVLFQGENGRIFINRDHLTGKPVEDLTKADRQWLEAEADKLSGGRHLPAAEGEAWPQRYRGPNSISRNHMRNFFDCVRSRKLPASDIFSHHRVMNSCHMCTIAIKLKRKLTWDPLKEEFIGDAEANAMLTRPQRSPYEIRV
jgi:predicted dehydrogenase